MYGDHQLFSDLDLVTGPADVIGLVGANSAGKSTLLQRLAGAQAPDAETVTISPPTATIGYVRAVDLVAQPYPGLPGPYSARRRSASSLLQGP